MRIFGLLALVSLLFTACVNETQTQLSLADLHTLSLQKVNVMFASRGLISWPSEEYAFAETKGYQRPKIDPTQSGPENTEIQQAAYAKFVNTEDTRQFVRSKVSDEITSASQSSVSQIMTGERPVEMDVIVHQLVLVSGFQTFLLGGDDVFNVTVSLQDPESGATLIDPLTMTMTASNLYQRNLLLTHLMVRNSFLQQGALCRLMWNINQTVQRRLRDEFSPPKAAFSRPLDCVAVRLRSQDRRTNRALPANAKMRSNGSIINSFGIKRD